MEAFNTHLPLLIAFTDSSDSDQAIMLSIGADAQTLMLNNLLAATQGPLPEVKLLSDNPDQGTLWREFWHAGLGLTEEDLVRDFKIPVGADQTISNAFDYWLQGDCGANHQNQNH
jgi:hypothetical protein